MSVTRSLRSLRLPKDLYDLSFGGGAEQGALP